jgi:hypothetical protein
MTGVVPVNGQTPAPAQLIHPLPPTDLAPGWQWSAPPTAYSPADLFEYINGNADLYLAYDFVELVTVEFLNGEQSLVVDIYNMGNPLNAFGIYSTYRSPESEYARIGTEAMVSDYYIRFLQDRYVVDLNLNDATPELLQFANQAAQEISRRIGGDKQFPEILNYLPLENLVDKSPKYISEGLLGYRFLPRGLEAQYRIADFQVKVFIVLTDGKVFADSAFAALEQQLEQKSALADDPKWIAGKLPYHQFALVCQKGNFIFGILDLPDPKSGLELWQTLAAKIPD